MSKQRLIAPVNVATADQIADPGTKRWVNAVKFWRMASQIFGPHQSINDILSVLERSKTSTSELVEQEAQVALVSTVSNLSDSVNYVEGNMFTNIFGSSDMMNDSTVSDDDNLEEERIYNNAITCLTISNTYNNLHAPGAWMSALAREYISYGMGHMLPERLANNVDELLFVRLSQLEANSNLQVNQTLVSPIFSRSKRKRYNRKNI